MLKLNFFEGVPRGSANTVVFLSSANSLDKSRTYQNIFFVYKIKYKSNIPVCPQIF